MSVLPLPAGEPGRDLLEHVAVAVGVAERCPGEVRAPAVGVETWGPRLLDLAHVNPASDEVGACGVDVVDYEEQPVGRAGLSGRPALAELDRASGMGRRELHRSHVFADDKIDVEAPAEALIEGLR